MPENSTLETLMRSKLKKTSLIILGILVVVSLFFIFKDNVGTLFKGQLINPNPAGTENPPGAGVSFNFPPTVIPNSEIPTKDSTTVPIQAGNASIKFDEENLVIDKANVINTMNDVTLKKVTGSNDAETGSDLATQPISYTEATKTLTIPYAQLEYSTKYKIKIPKDTIKAIQADGSKEPLEADIIWYFTTAAQTTPPTPPPPCINNVMRNEDKEICQRGVFITCDTNEAGNRTLDNLRVCQSGKWVLVTTVPPPTPTPTPPPSPTPPPAPLTCTENRTKTNDTYICKATEWIKCTASREGEKSTDNKKECKDGKWTTIVIQTEEIKILKASIFPIGFNPLLAETKITYKISAKAKIELKISNSSGVKVATLINNVEIDKGEHEVPWNGTDDEGDVVAPGSYVFKITAKDPQTDEVKDAKADSLTIVYYNTTRDFEDGGGTTAGTPTTPITPAPPAAPRTVAAPAAAPQYTASEIAAIMSLQAAQSGETAGTGPSVLIYLLIPVASYLFTRTRK